MLVVTSEQVAGHHIRQTLGQCYGVVVRSRGLGGNIMAGLRSIVGGEIREYTQMLEQARRHAVDRLVENAALMGANGIVMMRFELVGDRPDHERNRRLWHRGGAGTCGGLIRVLRRVLIWIGAALVLAGLCLLVFAGLPGGFLPLALGAVLLLALAIERYGYKRVEHTIPGADWQPTGERFRDPDSDTLVAVYYHPRTGRRAYVRITEP